MSTESKAFKSSWWWLGSPKLLSQFEGDTFAQAYETMRRVPKFKSELFFYEQNGRTWRQMELANRQLFTMTYKRWLERLGWYKAITVGPEGISFDCSRSNHFLMEALRNELAQPTPVVMGEGPSRGFKASRRVLGIASYNRHVGDEPAYTSRIKNSKNPSWVTGFTQSGVYLTLPRFTKLGGSDPLPVREITAYFRSFIRDNPPKDFADFRKKCCNLGDFPRAPRPRSITFGIMAHDFCTVSMLKSGLEPLAELLLRPAKRKNGKIIFQGPLKKLHKDLLNGKARMVKVMSDATALR
jgi:hypothetical protein